MMTISMDMSGREDTNDNSLSDHMQQQQPHSLLKLEDMLEVVAGSSKSILSCSPRSSSRPTPPSSAAQKPRKISINKITPYVIASYCMVYRTLLFIFFSISPPLGLGIGLSVYTYNVFLYFIMRYVIIIVLRCYVNNTPLR